MSIWRLSAVVLLTAALVATGIFVSGVVQASHNFSDVPTTAFYHPAVEWVANRAITAGCAVGLYCPDNPVTRGQMAVFLQKEGQALTPTFVNSGSPPGGDPITGGSSSNICMTTGIVPPFPQQAFIMATNSTLGMGAHTQSMAPQYSTDGGTTWTYTDPFPGSTASTSTANQCAHTSYGVNFDMTPGTTYVFSLKVSVSGSNVAAFCHLNIASLNRNPSTSPLAPAPPITREQKFGR